MAENFWNDEKTENINTASMFAINLVNRAMEKYNTDFPSVDAAMKKAHLWDRLNNLEIALIMAHDGIDEYLEEIGNNLA